MSDSLCELLEWDSAFFGIRIGRVKQNHLTASEMTHVMAWCHQNRVRCLYFLCAPDRDESVTLAESHEFHLVDIRVELEWQAASLRELDDHPDGSITLRTCRDGDLATLSAIAESLYDGTRFAYDQHWSRAQIQALYREWITKSCNGFANTVWVALRDDKLRGYVSCHLEPPSSGRIGLMGVASDLQNEGIGRKLVMKALHYFAEQGVEQVYVVTQGRNISAQRLYEKCGFRSHSLGLWYHRWF
jgi:dTDP-4-amino-4,6-dideoxy-D-galactose acyltransferase